MSILYVIDINVVVIFYVIVDYAYVWWRSDFVRGNNETSVINANEIDYCVWFDALKSMVEIGDMISW